MAWRSEKNKSTLPFSTPPSTSWRPPYSPEVVMPMSERKWEGPGCKRDLFHVIHKVPAGDSPYVRAKHAQLIDKDPGKAISLFWAAINAGDRTDSALKDMAVVMKQLNRSDEAIEAIKSFRHLCSFESQESIENLLMELYKRSGRTQEHIEMLQNRLRRMDATGVMARRTKPARNQGKKVQVSFEQEKSRLLGNLGWAYLQQHNYGLAEQHYRQALTLDPDKNKQCNLAICLMHMKRVAEAKSLIMNVKASCGNRPMDDSFVKSYERAVHMISELQGQSSPAADDVQSSVDSGCCPLRQEHAGPSSSSPFLYTQPRPQKPTRSAAGVSSQTHTPEPRGPRLLVSRSDTKLSGEQNAASAGKGSQPASQPRESTSAPKKTWADMAEEEETEGELMSLTWRFGSICFGGEEGCGGESSDENLDMNIMQEICATSGVGIENLKEVAAFTPTQGRKSSARRSLCFEGEEEKWVKRRNRLQVFQEITPSPCSP